MGWRTPGVRTRHRVPVAVSMVAARFARLAAATVLALGFLACLPVSPAQAAPAKPPTDWSFYILSTSTSTAYNLGCNQGHFDANHGNIDSEVFLDFGGQNSAASGTKLINGTNISNGTVEAIAEQFVYGYWVCTGADLTSYVHFGIGTNNSFYSVNSTGGQVWGRVVNAVGSWVSAHAGQAFVWGANDIEPSWSSASGAINWAKGFDSTTGALYLNYGSADGCPQYSSSNGGCNNGWNQYDVWYVSWGSPPAITAPEIYTTSGSQARQWAMISLYGAQHQSGRVFYQGPLDEYDLNTGTNTASAAWTQLWNALNANSATAQTPPFSLEVHRE